MGRGVLMSYLNGISRNDNIVMLSPAHRKFEFVYIFESDVSAKEFYIDFDFDTNRMTLERLKEFFCKHENEYELDVGSEYYHYDYCPKCDRGVYMSDETPEENDVRINEMWRLARTNERIAEIQETKDSIERKISELKHLEDGLEAIRTHPKGDPNNEWC